MGKTLRYFFILMGSVISVVVIGGAIWTVPDVRIVVLQVLGRGFSGECDVCGRNAKHFTVSAKHGSWRTQFHSGCDEHSPHVGQGLSFPEEPPSR
jgi:hypothetical protein